MIIVRLQGGLGNQLFQYAAGKALSSRLGVPIKLETLTSLNKKKSRDLELDKFLIDFELATPGEVRSFVLFPQLYRHFPNLIAGTNVYREPFFQYDRNFNKLKDPVYLDGFWQSPFYFQDIEELIRKEFSIRKEFINHLEVKGSEFRKIDSVSVHIRRTDFMKPKAAAYHGVLPSSYYHAAISLIKERVPGAILYFFSDDIEWVKQNLNPTGDSVFVSETTKSAIEDFFLMSSCRHNIIANSSFSWWAAWLNSSGQKIVIAPSKWFARPEINTSDLIPKDWIRL